MRMLTRSGVAVCLWLGLGLSSVWPADPSCPLLFRNLVTKGLDEAKLLVRTDRILEMVKDTPGLSTPLRKFPHVFCHAAFARSWPSLLRRSARSLRVKRHSNGLAIV